MNGLQSRFHNTMPGMHPATYEVSVGKVKLGTVMRHERYSIQAGKYTYWTAQRADGTKPEQGVSWPTRKMAVEWLAGSK